MLLALRVVAVMRKLPLIYFEQLLWTVARCDEVEDLRVGRWKLHEKRIGKVSAYIAQRTKLLSHSMRKCISWHQSEEDLYSLLCRLAPPRGKDLRT